ncbi:MAG: C-GCAxxG-C-C family protein [Acutalibacteraceae bacterium]|nr:C_GCAxxG_C_C family protein [Clostridia bacterium]MEE1144893.1 C-GCAxxG-C-C family protein [Acutalibacteraceae bacterium]
MKRSEKAKQYFESGYNCSQAVVMAFADAIGLDIDTAQRISAPFGGGMGRLREVCGAVSGMIMVEGMIREKYDPKDVKSKTEQYKTVQTLAGKFRDKNGSIVCRELLGLDKNGEKISPPEPSVRTEQYYKKRPCALLVQDAAEILEEYFNL